MLEVETMHKFLQKPIDPVVVGNNQKVSDLLQGMSQGGFQGKNLGMAVDVWENMFRKQTTIMFGLAGAMIPAGMRKVIVYLIENRLIDCIVSTGANLFHDCHETLGKFHWQGNSCANDVELFEHGIDRIYDVFAPEAEFRETDLFMANFAKKLAVNRRYTTREFFALLGEEIYKNTKEEGIVTAAAKANIPIYCPALGDSSIGIGLAYARAVEGKHVEIDVIQDVVETAEIAAQSPQTGVIYIGGGTPKNFIQQTEVTASVLSKNSPGHRFALQITTDAPHWGGLSGCTFEEAQSWGKIHGQAEKVTVNADATIALPLIVQALTERIVDKRISRETPSFTWDENGLKLSFNGY